MPRRAVRIAATALVLAGASTVLAACDKPVPKVTFLAGSTTIVVSPQTYCFDPTHCRPPAGGNVGIIKARAGSTVLVDVPRAVADGTWEVKAGELTGANSFTQLTGAGTSSSVQHDSHSVRLQVPYPASGVDSYYLAVIQTQGSVQTGSWIAQVDIVS